MVERQLPKLNVVGSSPIIRFIKIAYSQFQIDLLGNSLFESEVLFFYSPADLIYDQRKTKSTEKPTG